MTDDNLQPNSSQEPVPVELEDGTHYYDSATGQEITELFEPSVFDDDVDDEDYDYEDDADEDDNEEQNEENSENDEEENNSETGEENPEERPEGQDAGNEAENASENPGEGAGDGAAEAGAESAAEGAAEAGAEAAVEAGAEAAAEAAASAAAETAAAGAGEAAAGSTAEFWIPALIIIVVLVQVVVFAMAFMGYGDANTPSIYPAGGTVAKGKGYSLQNNTDYSGTPCAAGSTDNGTYTHPTEGFVIRLCATEVGQVASVNSQNVVSLLAAAKKDGVTLGGSSFRSYERQIELRKQNCPDWQNSPSQACTPDTAKPGNSMHEKGLATDFTDGSSTIKSKSSAQFIWLSNNASKYGYYNYPAETWHWSTSGG